MSSEYTPVTFGDDTFTGWLEPFDEYARFSLRDERTGRVWGPTPLLALDMHDRTVLTCSPNLIQML